MTRLAQTHKDSGLVVLAVNARDESKSVLSQFADELKVRHTILMNGSEVHAHRFGLSGVPHTFWIDRGGVVAAAEIGFDGAAHLEKKTRRILQQ